METKETRGWFSVFMTDLKKKKKGKKKKEKDWRGSLKLKSSRLQDLYECFHLCCLYPT